MGSPKRSQPAAFSAISALNSRKASKCGRRNLPLFGMNQRRGRVGQAHDRFIRLTLCKDVLSQVRLYLILTTNEARDRAAFLFDFVPICGNLEDR